MALYKSRIIIIIITTIIIIIIILLSLLGEAHQPKASVFN